MYVTAIGRVEETIRLPYDAGLSAAAETLVRTLKRVIVSQAVYPRFLEIAELARSLCHSWATCYATVEKRRRGQCVSLCVPKTLRTLYLKNQWREFHPVLVTDVFGFVDGLIRFWDQKVKGQGHSKQLPENTVNTISQKSMNGISPNFAHRCIWVRRCADQILGSKVQRSRSQQAIIQNLVNTIIRTHLQNGRSATGEDSDVGNGWRRSASWKTAKKMVRRHQGLVGMCTAV